eukprot:CAMPEP_0175311742 /NCGR_PEP_ID=MMETSP0093-20121207/66999_1 /TAXON_ID=311494 /ORGANISM="Alexandrium monilatum, Strain CCMP3105" /LENGTH=85 /DNA_ID=CAMNT_0016608375 /DNA_START=323 /DNA_END=580 /DNA_ORIENTATION=-
MCHTLAVQFGPEPDSVDPLGMSPPLTEGGRSCAAPRDATLQQGPGWIRIQWGCPDMSTSATGETYRFAHGDAALRLDLGRIQTGA